MKLINFNTEDIFADLKNKMSIPKEYPARYEYEHKAEKPEFESLELMELDTGKGKEVTLDILEIGSRGEIISEDNSVILFMKNQRAGSGYKYHISWCSKLEEMKQNNKQDKYVVSRRNDGIFYANIIDREQNIVEEDREVEMKVCRYCLGKLNYKGYKNVRNQKERDKIYNDFSIEDFLSEHDTKFDHLPRHTEDTIPVDVYSEGWSYESKRYREYRKWKCEKCGKDLSKRKHMIDTHHIDGNKFNNNYSNFMALCKSCHSKEPGHEEYRAKLERDGRI